MSSRLSTLAGVVALVAGSLATGLAQDATGAATGATGAGGLAPVVAIVEAVEEKTKAASIEEAALCKEEHAAAEEWFATVNSPEAQATVAANKAAREKGMRALGDALTGRLKVLNDFLAKLYKARQRLGNHIHRVNTVFHSVYAANQKAQLDAAEAIRLLGLSIARPHSPKFNPIKLPKHEEEADKAEAASLEQDPTIAGDSAVQKHDEEISAAEAEAGSTSEEPAATGAAAGAAVPADSADEELNEQADLANVGELSLIQLEARIHEKMVSCVGKECDEAYKAAFELYKHTYVVNKKNKGLFETERASLGKFRDGLKALIKKKEDKVAALGKQLAELNKALSGAEPSLSDLFPLIKEHLAVSKSACGQMKGRTDQILKMREDLETMLKAGEGLDCDKNSEPAPVIEEPETEAPTEAPTAPPTSAPTPEPEEPADNADPAIGDIELGGDTEIVSGSDPVQSDDIFDQRVN